MTKLTPQARSLFEMLMDNYLDDPLYSYNWVEHWLAFQGIEPTLETVLSHISGVVYGIMVGKEVTTLKGDEFEEYRAEIYTLIARRAWELQEAFSKTKSQ